jgi:RNA polymerase sigma-70 factor (ECF subfamily)
LAIEKSLPIPLGAIYAIAHDTIARIQMPLRRLFVSCDVAIRSRIRRASSRNALGPPFHGMTDSSGRCRVKVALNRFFAQVMTKSTEDFAGLFELARRGDSEAMEQLCRQYEPRLRLVARVLLGPALRPHLDSIDLVQSVHRSLLVGLRSDKFDISTPDGLIGLAVTMVRRKIARQWSRLQRQQRLSSDSAQGSPQALANLSAPNNDPARAAQYNDQLEHLRRHLDETEQLITELRLQGYSTAEIAERLQMNHTTLRVRMTRLRERLRTQGLFHDWL